MKDRANDTVAVQVAREPHCDDIPLPEYQTQHASGMDLRAAVREPLVLAPGDIALVPTGLRIALPPGYEAQIRPRSGLALRYGLTLPNSPATIDADYRGPLNVILMNAGRRTCTIHRADRIAQMVVAPVAHARWVEIEQLDDTARGHGGFGHTGVR